VAILLAVVVALGLAAGAVATTAGRATAQPELIAYRMVAQWPQRDSAAGGLLQSPADLDIDFEGRVFIADPGIGGIQTLLPSGVFTTPFGVSGGLPGQLGRVGAIAVGPNPPPPGFTPPPGGMPPVPLFGERLYVLDTAAERVVVYNPDGQFLAEWPRVNAQGITASNDGRVYVLDRDTSQVRALDSATGAQKFVFGERGTENGQFANFTDVDVTPDGRVLVVADRRGARVQLFDLATDEALAGATPPAPVVFRKDYDLTNAAYQQADNRCDASRVSALGENKVFVGEGVGACLIDERKVSFAIAASANRGAICRATVSLPRLRPIGDRYIALAVSDPNAGKCGEKRTELDTVPVVVKYDDDELRGINTVWQAASNEDSDNPLLFAPDSISLPAEGVMFVSDSSSQFHYFDTTGKQVAAAERASSSGSFSGDFEFFQVIYADGSDVLGEVLGYYLKGQRRGQDFTIEGGIGRFKTVEKRTQTGTERVIEPVWTDPLISSFEAIEVPALAWNKVSREFLTVQNESVAQQRTQDISIVRYAPDGRKLKPSIDLPDDGKVNPYADLAIGPEGRIYVLDDLADVVRVYEPDGRPVRDVPVVFDARALAAGPESPDGAIFVLREPGSIERYADDGRITARLDGRPLPSSDATTLSDLVVDGAGRVYVADGQSSLISVFEPAGAREEIPIPNDAECLFQGDAKADPAQVRLGESTAVTLTLRGRCGINENPADIVVLVPYFKRLQQGVDPSSAYMTEMTLLMSRLNFGKHRAGIVSYYNTTKKELPLTTDRAAYIDAVRNINRFDPPSDSVKPRLRDALEVGGTLFDNSPGRRKVMVLLRAEYCTPEFELFPGQCTGVPPAEDAALALRQAGVTLIVINSFGADDLASSDEDAFYGVGPAHRRMVRYAPPSELGTDLVVTSQVPATMNVDAASISRGGSWQAPNLTWQWDALDFGGGSFGARLTPLAGGSWPTSQGAVANFTDGWGHPQSVTFPVPDVTVLVDAPTPTNTAPPPTATPTTVPPTSTPVPTAKPRAVFLPLAYASQCKAEAVPVDVALVIDVSSSMNVPTTPGGPTKMQAARDAAAAFVTGLRTQDRVAIVTFDAGARIASPLSGDLALADAAIRALATGSGTRIDLGLTAGREVLAGARPDATTALVLLTDGRPSTTVENVRAAADDVRGAGITVYTIGLGADVDGPLLATVAGDSTRYFEAPDAAGLGAIYAKIGSGLRVVCR
jgi:hypothetical protein